MQAEQYIAAVEARLAQIERECNDATEGPWHVVEFDSHNDSGFYLSGQPQPESQDSPHDDVVGSLWCMSLPDMHFTASARTLVPALVAYGKQLCEALRQAEAKDDQRTAYHYANRADVWTSEDDRHSAKTAALRAQLAAFAQSIGVTTQEDGNAAS